MRKARFLALPILAIAGLMMSLSGCGSGGSSTPPPPPNPTPSSSGLNVYPSTASVPVGGTVDFTGYVPSNPTDTITWAVSGSSNGSITSSGVYTAPASAPSPAQVTVTATSGSFTGTAVVTVTSAQGIAVNPAAASVAAGSQTTFTATGATGTVTWEVNGTQGGDGVHGTIDANGNYTAPLTPPSGGSTVITAVAGATSGNSTVTIVYSNASLSGAYAFSYSGDDTSGFLAVAGNFTADSSSGTITGIEDILDTAGLTSNQSVSGTFSIGPDGRGAVNLTPTQEVWQIALSSNQHAVFINFGSIATTGFATGSGTIDQQTTAPQPLSTAQQHYVFQLAGLDANLSSLAIAGAFSSEGNGAIAPTGNVIDINDAGSAGSTTQNTVNDTTLTGSFIPSPGAPSAGTLSLSSTDIGEIARTTTGTTLLFDFYIVSPNRIHLVETDGNAFLAGDAYVAVQPGNSGYTANAVLGAGKYSFTLGGSTANGAYVAGGVLVSAGASSGTATSGSITGGVFDNNAQNAQSQTDATLKSATVGVDATTGRMTLSSLSTNQTHGNFSLVAYASAPDPTSETSPPVLLLETDANIVASGTAYLQNAAASPSGNFALNLSGAATSAGTEQDELAALNIAGTAITGTMDINNAEAQNNGEQLGISVGSGSTILSVDSNGRGTATVKLATGATFQFAYYGVDANTVVLIDTDASRVAAGIMLKQF